MDWDSIQHPGDVTENRVATFDDVIHDWRETSLVCDVDTISTPFNPVHLVVQAIHLPDGLPLPFVLATVPHKCCDESIVWRTGETDSQQIVVNNDGTLSVDCRCNNTTVADRVSTAGC